MTATDRIEALRAGLVKPLVWIEGDCLGDKMWTADGYTIDDHGARYDDNRYFLTHPVVGYEYHAALELAQAAANIHNATRILSALHPDLDAMLALMAEAVGALQEVKGCFDAAETEGLTDRLLEAGDYEPGSLAGLVVRRLVWAGGAATECLAKIAGGAE